MTVQRQIDRLLSYRASEWIEILKHGGPEEQAAFVDWLRESRRHVEEYLTMVALEQELEGIDLKNLLDRKALLKRVSSHVTPLHEAPATPLHFDAQTKTSPRNRRRKIVVALAAGLSALTLTSMFMLDGSALPREFVATDRQRAIELADGSVVQLNSHSRVRVHLNVHARELELVSGEALFKVARDSRRPFRVRADDAVVEALGTQFNIHDGPEGTTVSVVEGKVRVSVDQHKQASAPAAQPAAFAAGEEARIDEAGIQRNAAADVTAAIAWRQRRLVFQKTPLEEVVRQFNRHNAVPKLRIEGIEPGSRHYSATFDADDPESFGDFLSRESDLTIRREDDRIVIRRFK